MRAGNHAKRAVVFFAIVQVDTDREHLLQNCRRRTNMDDICFARPWAPALDVKLFANGDHTVLMPGDLPIRFWILVKEDSPYSKTLVSKHGCDQPPHLVRARDGAHDLIGQKVANAVLASIHCGFLSLDGLVGYTAVNQRIPLRFDLARDVIDAVSIESLTQRPPSSPHADRSVRAHRPCPKALC